MPRWRFGLIAAFALFALIGAWLGVFRHSLVGWMLVVVGAAFLFVESELQRKERRAEEAAQTEWVTKIRELADDIRLEGYGIESLEDLSRYHDATGRAAVLARLQSLPAGHRDLLVAARSVEPDAVWD
jgi:hypothetical protein